MTTVNLKPDGKVSAVGMTDNLTPHTKLSDGSTATTEGATGSSAAEAVLTLGTVAMPAGAVTKTVAISATAQAASGANLPGYLYAEIRKANNTTVLATMADSSFTSAVSWRAVATVAQPATLAQADVDGLLVYFRLNKRQAKPFAVVLAEISVNLVYVAAPTVAIGTITTALDTVTVPWTYSQADIDGGPQAQWQVRVFSAAQAAASGFDPAMSACLVETSGADSSIQAVLSGLPDGTNHVAYVRVAELINGVAHWSTWTSGTFTITLTRAEVASITPTAVPASNQVSLAITRDTGKDAWSSVKVQRLAGTNQVAAYSTLEAAIAGSFPAGFAGGVLSGAPSAGPAWSVQTGVAGHGQVQRVVVTNTTWSSVYLTMLGTATVNPGDIIDIFVDANSAAWNDNVIGLGCFWTAPNGGFGGWSDLFQPVSAGWRRYWTQLTVPAGVVTASPIVEVKNNTGAAGTSTTVDIDNIVMMVNAGGWKDVPWASITPVQANSVTIVDNLPPSDLNLEYRARAVKATGTNGAWLIATPGVFSYTATSWWLRDATTGQGVMVPWEPDGTPADVADVPVGAFDVLGRSAPVTVTDVPKLRGGSFRVECLTPAEADALIALARLGRQLVISQPIQTGPMMTIVPTSVRRERATTQIVGNRQYVTIEFARIG